MKRIKEERIEGGKVRITSECTECGEHYVAIVTELALNKFKTSRELIQRIFPELSADQRELHFQSGICGICWDEMFSDSDEDDEDEE